MNNNTQNRNGERPEEMKVPAPKKKNGANPILRGLRFIGIVFICVFEEIGSAFKKLFRKLKSASPSLKVGACAVLLTAVCVSLIVTLAMMVSGKDDGEADCVIGADKHVIAEAELETVPSADKKDEPPAKDTEIKEESAPAPESDAESAPEADEAPQSPDGGIVEEPELDEDSNVRGLPDDRYAVTIDFYSKEDIRCVSGERTVGELMSILEIYLSDTDILRCETDTVINADTVIHVDEISYGTDSVSTEIPYDTEYHDVQTIPRGSQTTGRRGVLGSSVVEYSVTYINGVETERVQTAEYVSTYPVSAVVYRGVGGTVESLSFSYYLDCNSTMYYSGGTTASGLPADENVVAVDPNVIPLGTRLYIPGIGVRIAADTGGLIKGNIVGICFDRDNPMAQGYGRRDIRVYILD